MLHTTFVTKAPRFRGEIRGTFIFMLNEWWKKEPQNCVSQRAELTRLEQTVAFSSIILMKLPTIPSWWERTRICPAKHGWKTFLKPLLCCEKTRNRNTLFNRTEWSHLNVPLILKFKMQIQITLTSNRIQKWAQLKAGVIISQDHISLHLIAMAMLRRHPCPRDQQKSIMLRKAEKWIEHALTKNIH